MGRFLDIAGSERIIDIFGDWPSFHDAEVISICFDRNQCSGIWGPTIEVQVHVFQITNDIVKGYFKTINHTIINFIFIDAVEISLNSGFSIQNALGEFFVKDIRGHQLENLKFEVHFDGHSSCDLRFKCSKIEITSVESGIPVGSVYNLDIESTVNKSSPPKAFI